MGTDLQFAPPNELAVGEHLGDWARRNEHWLIGGSVERRRSKRHRRSSPLILCGHGVSLRIDRGTLQIQDGITHFPQERVELRFFRGDLNLPPRIIMLDGSGTLSFDVVSWLAEQNVPLFRIDWRGDVASVIGGQGFAVSPERVQWQIETRQDPERRLAFSRDLIAAKLRNSIETLRTAVPPSPARTRAIGRAETSVAILDSGSPRTVESVRAIEAVAAATYFNAWKGLPLRWRSTTRLPIPEAWLTIGPRRSMGRGRFATNKHATHPLNAMLNYAYAVLRSQVQIEAAAEGYDPRRGIMHHDRDDTQALVYDLLEPRRPIVDAKVLDFALKTPFTGADFVMREDGVCRVTPQLARRICAL